MPPYRNHVEARSSRRPVRQYVSETHDHKPDAPGLLSRLKATKKVETIDDERLTGRGLIVRLRKGWSFHPSLDDRERTVSTLSQLRTLTYSHMALQWPRSVKTVPVAPRTRRSTASATLIAADAVSSERVSGTIPIR